MPRDASLRSIPSILRWFPVSNSPISPARTTKKALVIVSFGDHCTKLWEDGSRPYNQLTLESATQHVDSMQANYGGTEIRAALQECFETRKTDRPTAVFVLTDGKAWDLDGVFNEVKGAVARATTQAYLRVSVLGIGKSVSTAMCEGIVHETTFTGKIARMLKAARMPLISDIRVDWGVPIVDGVDKDDSFVMIARDENGNGSGNQKGKEKEKENKKTTLNIFDDTVDPIQVNTEPAPQPPDVVLTPLAQVQQTPSKIRTFSTGNRLNVFAILQGKTVPETVTLTRLTEDGSEIRLPVPVTLSNLPNTPESPPAIHALSSRGVI
ncbi:hypothetical protein DFH07DRAFT_966336 [Mycena maculata]|uniref:VWFA domain-containing protein n=1 Tax=Mycena maculata TaxID=230809 RepID=A0AAD7MXZ2_9AGAR|nr:hypothetical protein DFH07DRAFT_966336 [Mycena maculata]